MTTKINRLPPHVVEQIAAGEVIDRPASVAKELVDNALDASATHVIVELTDGGKKSLRVVDNGSGMSPLDTELALVRHATSKLKSTEDLFNLQTLGFRGEGLSSVAAISRVNLSSRPNDAAAGFRLQVAAGNIAEKGPIGMPTGTQIDVIDLFYNVPARLKFLKSSATEAAYVIDTVTALSRSYPHVRFELKNDGKTVFDYPVCRNRWERAQQIVARKGSSEAATLRHLQQQFGATSLQACLTSPEHTSGSSRSLCLLVNNRPVRDRSLMQAILAGYGDALPRGRYPIGAVFIDIDPQQVDVNVHPQKAEVRFADPATLFKLMRLFIGQIHEQESGRTAVHSPMPKQTTTYPSSYSKATRSEAARRFWTPPSSAARAPTSSPPQAYLPAIAAQPAAPYQISPIRFVGQVLGRYWVCEGRDPHGEQLLVILEPRRVQQQLLIRKLKAALTDQSAPAQQLLHPATLQLNPPQLRAATTQQDLLATLGLCFESFGDQSIVVRAVPAALCGHDPAQWVANLLTALSEGDWSPFLAINKLAQHIYSDTTDDLRLPSPEILIDQCLQNGMTLPELARTCLLTAARRTINDAANNAVDDCGICLTAQELQRSLGA